MQKLAFLLYIRPNLSLNGMHETSLDWVVKANYRLRKTINMCSMDHGYIELILGSTMFSYSITVLALCAIKVVASQEDKTEGIFSMVFFTYLEVCLGQVKPNPNVHRWGCSAPPIPKLYFCQHRYFLTLPNNCLRSYKPYVL